MRRFVIAAVLIATVGVVPAAHANHRPNSYCSESGDVCQSTQKEHGVRRLKIGLGAKYFSRYHLCVVAPDDSRKCIKRKITDQGASYGDSVNWATHFPGKGEGEYDVIWRQGGSRLGKVLGFDIPNRA
jgi:hypothetical protein